MTMELRAGDVFDSVTLLIKSLHSLNRIVRLLESRLTPAEQAQRTFYRYFDVNTRLLMYEIKRTKGYTCFYQLETLITPSLRELCGIVSFTRTAESQYEPLNRLNTIWSTEVSESDRLAQIIPCLMFGDAKNRQVLLDTLQDCSDSLSAQNPDDFILEKAESTVIFRRQHPPYHVRDTAAMVYEAISKRIRCTCHGHDVAARIALATYRKQVKDVPALDFDIILCLDTIQNKWKETLVQAELKQELAKASTVRFTTDDTTLKQPKVEIQKIRKRIEQLCQPFQAALKLRTHKLRLELVDGQLYKTKSINAVQFSPNDLPHVISLGQLISSSTYGLGDKTKRVLAVMMGYAVLHFVGSSWLDSSWSKDDVLFTESASVIPLRPYILKRITKVDSNSQQIDSQADAYDSDFDPDDLPIHPYPELVGLGIILLEIYFGKPIEALAGDSQYEDEDDEIEEGNVNAKWSTAQSVFDRLKADLSDKYCKAVDACLDTNFGSDLSESSAPDLHTEDMRRLIYNEIIMPLEDELEQGFGKSLSVDNLDAIVPNMDIKSWGRTFEGSLLKAQTQDDTLSRQQSFVSQSQISTVCEVVSMAPCDRQGFEIAIICALQIEADTIHLMFDKFWEDEGRRYGQAPGDSNVYTTGMIGNHNVVLAYIPGMGKVNASAVAVGIRSSFPSIKLALVVGICGGVPSTGPAGPQIYLGDLIISTALVQYDFGRQLPGAFLRKDTVEESLGRPSPKISALLDKLRTARYRQILEESTTMHAHLISQKLPGTTYPGLDKDILYHPSYTHKHHATVQGLSCPICEDGSDRACHVAMKLSCQQLGCEDDQRVLRPRKTKNSGGTHVPSVHFGKMGTGDAIMRSGSHRDQTAQLVYIIGFEMEGSGVWDHFPSIVLKGVCDYADSHKNKDWQGHAAAVAAAGMKALLAEW